jgi:hypothetical protein
MKDVKEPVRVAAAVRQKAKPPNFYAYVSGKAGIYILIEIILFVVLSFLTLGVGTAARLTAILVGFPSTLPGACHLGIQLHRGDHIFSRSKEEPYHKFVSSLLVADAEDILKCYGRTELEEKNLKFTS